MSTEFFFKNVRLSALINNGTVSMRLIAIGRAFHNRGPTTLNERSPKLTIFVRGTANRCCCEERVRPVEHCRFSKIQRCRAADASKNVQKNFKFDAMFDRKPVQLPENWCDVVTAWCEGNYPGSDVCLRQRFSQ